MSRKQHIFVVGIVIIAMMLWGMTFIWYKEAYRALRPLSLVFLRLFIASSLLLAVTYFLGKLQIIRRKDLSLFLILAFLFYTYSIKKLGMTGAAVYSNLIPVFAALFAWIILREKLTWLKISGMLIVISGLLLSQYKPERQAENRKEG